MSYHGVYCVFKNKIRQSLFAGRHASTVAHRNSGNTCGSLSNLALHVSAVLVVHALWDYGSLRSSNEQQEENEQSHDEISNT
uniref:Ovule protein n=1 Tax=Bursaphelenchus xylophilus TaxID=6326 RepID=A0A1I7S852_BURXY